MASRNVCLAILLFLAAGLISPSFSQTCSNRLTINNVQKNFDQCRALSQGAALAWTFSSNNRTLEIGFTGALPSSSGWAGWGYNPSGPNMVGSSALILYNKGSTPQLNLYSLTTQTKGGQALQPVTSTSDVLRVLSNSSEIKSDSSVSFTAVLQLASSSSNIFHVWNRGASVNGDSPQSHATDSSGTTSRESLNLATGGASQIAVPRLHLKNAHGLLNAIGWGILLPIGAMSARYLRSFEWADPTWFYLHVSCQSLGYILGVVGWAIGLRLGSDSEGIVYNKHRNIGITMFVFGTLQVFAIVLRPNKTHQYRMFWNVYHHTIGYLTIILAIVNIFKGFDMLQPDKGWKNAYIGIIIALGVIALILEVVTWIAWFHRRSQTKAAPISGPNKNSNNPYAARWDDQTGNGSRV